MIPAPSFGEAAPALEESGFDPVPIRPGGKAPAPPERRLHVPAEVQVPGHADCGGIDPPTPRAFKPQVEARQPEAAEAVDRLAAARPEGRPRRVGPARAAEP